MAYFRIFACSNSILHEKCLGGGDNVKYFTCIFCQKNIMDDNKPNWYKFMWQKQQANMPG